MPTGTPPRWLKPMNKVLVGLQRLGIGGPPVLTVPGRRTGVPRRTPVSVLELDGERYLLGGFPGADWVRNARAAGTGTLSVGRRNETVRLVELDADAARPVLREWPVRVPSAVSLMKDAGVVPDGSPAAYEALAGVCAVFRIEMVGP
jgi:deazaflavin-dependent oxidoreductase (nitroreductase family)